MASLVPRPNGDTWIFPKCSNGKRRAVRFGKITQEEAEEARRRLTNLERTFQAGESPDPVTLAWMRSLDSVIYDRVVATGLTGVDPAAPKASKQSIGELVKQWESGQDVEPSTKVTYSQATRNLKEYFGIDRDVGSILPADGDKFLHWLRISGRKKSDEPMARATVSRRLRTIKDVFDFGVRLKWLDENPFSHLKSQGEVNNARNFYITQQLTDAIVKESTDLELAAMIAVSRYGSCRGPSEYSTLTWADVDFDRRVIFWTAPKTERYGSGRRMTENCEGALAALDRLWVDAPSGVDLVFPKLGGKSSSDIYGRLERVCKRLGLILWDKPFTNMRASCETDWQTAGYSIFETAAWMGHSPDVALRHYNRVVKDQIIDLPSPGSGEAKRAGEARPKKRSARRSNPTLSADNELSS